MPIDPDRPDVTATADAAPPPPAPPLPEPGSGAVARRLLRWADHPAGVAILALLALLEATVFPAPTEAMLVALTLARPHRGWWLGAAATGASVAGGMVGYYLGAGLFDAVARPVLAHFGLLGGMTTLGQAFRQNALLALATSGYTPIPYMLYTASAGAFGVSVPVFVVGSLVGRGLKYVPIAVLASVLGPSVQRVLARYAPWVAAALVLLAAVWFLVLR